MIPTSATIGELVVERAARATLFERLGLDYCCGGGRTLAEACAERDLDPSTVATLIEAFDAAPAPGAAEAHELTGATLAGICDHIESVHHERLRRDLPQLGELLNSVMRVHGPVHPELYALVPPFTELREELESHLDEEERTLFPACRSGEAVEDAVLAGFEHEHEHAGELLATLRDLTGGFDGARALCRTHRRLVEGLHALELDLHQHIHEENNVLLPRLRASRPAAEGSLPRCCEGWIGEEVHRRVRQPQG